MSVSPDPKFPLPRENNNAPIDSDYNRLIKTLRETVRNQARDLNKASADIAALKVKSVFRQPPQAGTINIIPGLGGGTSTISAVGPNAVVYHNGETNNLTTALPPDISAILTLTNPTTVTANRFGTGGNLFVNFIVLDYI